MSTTSIRVSVFRDDLIADPGETVRITARLSDEIAHAFEAMRDRQWGRPRLKLTYGRRVVEGEAGTVRRTVRAGGSDEVEVEIELVRLQPPQVDVMRAGTSGLSADELVDVHGLWWSLANDSRTIRLQFVVSAGTWARPAKRGQGC